ncbi:MAG: hypothetical protein AAGI28_15205 [Pseudomonadota bacterium]
MTEPTKTDTGNEVAPNSGFDFNQPTIISLCFLASFITGITGLVGIVLAHVWQGENKDSWAASHFSYLIRTFWFGFIGFFVAGILSIVFIGLLLMPLIAVWVGVRSVLSLLKAQRQEPMPEPQTLLF